MIYETDTNRVLVWDNAAWVMIADTDQPPGLQIITPTGATNGTVTGNGVVVGNAVSSVTVSGVFSSEFENYRIVYMGGSSSVDGDLKLTLGNTAAGYYMSLPWGAYTGTTGIANVNNGASWIYAGSVRPAFNSCVVDLYSPFSTNETIITGVYVGVSAGSVAGSIGGYLNNTTSYTDFTITPTTGNITGGTIRVYGYRN